MRLGLITIASACVNISVGVLVFNFYLKFKNISRKLKMNAEGLLQGIPQDTTQDVTTEQQQDSKKERLSAIVVGGGSKQYLGRELQLSDIDNMAPQEMINYIADMKPALVQV